MSFVKGINDGSYVNCATGRTDWRVPNKKEMLSLLDFSSAYPKLALPAGHPFTNIDALASVYWTSTTDPADPTTAATADLSTGAMFPRDKAGMNLNNVLADISRVWPVRSPVQTPIPEISVSPASINFNNTLVNAFSAPVTVTISNTGTTNLNVFSIFMLNTQDFILDTSAGSNPCGISTPVIASGENCTVTVTFKPDAVTDFNGMLSITSNSLLTEAREDISLSGAGVSGTSPDIALAPANHVFADTTVGISSPILEVTLSNAGNATLNISAITLSSVTHYNLNLNAGSSPCTVGNPVIAAGESCSVGVSFLPSVVANNLTSALTIASDDPDEASVTVPLSGNGVSETPPPSEDTTSPLVISVTPARNAGNVPAATGAITATFNEPVQGINVATFTAVSAGGTVTGTVHYDAAGMTAWLRPAVDFSYLTTYTVTISSAQVRDLVDNNLAQDYSWSFTTGGNPALAGCEPELQQEAGCVNFDSFTYGTGVFVNTYGSSVTGYTTERGARGSVSFATSLSEDAVSTDAFESQAVARVDSSQFSLRSRSRRMTSSTDRAGAESTGASRIDVAGAPPGAIIPMSIVVSGNFTGISGTLMLEVHDFDNYQGLGSISVAGSGTRNTYVRMIDPYGSKSDIDNFLKTTGTGSNIQLDFLYPASPGNGIYVWFVAGVKDFDGISNDQSDFTATLEVLPPPGVTVTLASGKVFTGPVDSDGDGVADGTDNAPLSATSASPTAMTGTGNIMVDVSGNPGVTLSQVRALNDDDLSLVQTGKPGGMDFPDGLVSFRLNGLAAGASASVNLTFPTAFPVGAKYYKVDANGFYEFPDATFSADRKTVTLRITDGVRGDSDGVANGVIVDPGGIGIAATGTDSVSSSSGSDGNNVFGCSMKLNTSPTGFDPLLLFMSLISLGYLCMRRRKECKYPVLLDQTWVKIYRHKF